MKVARAASVKSLVVFVALSYALAWLVAAPLWVAGGIQAVSGPVFTAIGILMMYTPTVAALVACKLDRKPLRSTLGLGFGHHAGRTVLTVILVVLAVALVALAGLLTSALLGTYTFDIVHLNGARQILEQQLAAAGQPMPDIPVHLLVPIIIAQSFTLGTLISSPAALGEEIGWRGYLTPALAERLGAPLATLAIGVIWGCWHAPLLLLGYNYPTIPGWQRLVWMSVFCTIVAAVLGWGRARTNSVIPAAIGHGAVNAGMATLALMLGSSPTLDTANATVMGWAGWPLALIIAGVFVTVLWPKASPEGGRVLSTPQDVT